MVMAVAMAAAYVVLTDLDNYFMVSAIALIFLTGIFGLVAHCEVCTIIKGIVPFILLTPTYINIFIIYSFANLHDCTWGTRLQKLTKKEEDRLDDFEQFRVRAFTLWIITNSALTYTLDYADRETNYGYTFMYVICFIGVMLQTLKFLGCIGYLFMQCAQMRKNRKLKVFVQVQTPMDTTYNTPALACLATENQA